MSRKKYYDKAQMLRLQTQLLLYRTEDGRYASCCAPKMTSWTR
jgi:hypothetical protein